MDRYLSGLNRQMIEDPERLTRHQPPHGSQRGFSPVELQASAPVSELEGQVITDAVMGGVPSYPIDTTPSQGGRGRKWTRAMSGAGEGGVTRTGYNREDQTVPFGSDACAQVSGPQELARGRDYGAGRYGTHAFMPHGPHGQMDGEQRSTVLVQGFPTTPMANQGGGYEQLRRGSNADPLNDGAATGGTGSDPRPTAWRVGEDDGSLWRPARYFHTPMERTMFHPTRQLPTDQVQINPARTPTMIRTTTVPAVPSKGGVLFASLAKFVPKAVPVGPLARTPGPWYEPAQAAAAAQDPGSLPDYSGVIYG